jgi:hypothetical protein
MEGMVKKYHIALFLNSGTSENPVWVRVKKSTSLELSMNPETQDYDYIVDQNPTTEVLRYKPSLNQPITMYKGEADYDFAFGKFYNLQTGEKAKCEVLVVYMQEDMTRVVDGITKTVYKSWRNIATLTVASFNAVDSIITLDVTFGGTIDHGYTYPNEGTKVPVFVKESDAEALWVDPFESDSQPEPPAPEAETPVFSVTWNETESVAENAELILDGTATVTDGGTVSYAWTVDGAEQAETTATFTVDTDTVGTYVIVCTATNTIDGDTATASQTCTVTVTA